MTRDACTVTCSLGHLCIMFTLQVAGAIHDIKPAAEIVDEMMSGALAGATCD